MRHFEKTEAEEKTDAGPNIKNDSEMNKGSSTGSDDSNNVVDDNSIDAKTNKNNIEKIDKGSAFMTYIFREWIMPVVIALLIVIFLNKFIFILVTVPTGSMEETIMPGDRLYVNELFDIKNAKRGDILVFKSDELDEKRLVKRLIGLPGDMVEVKADGTVFVNEEKLEEPYATQAVTDSRIFNVPENSYLFLGDNRPISYDARYWENPYINEEKIIGKAIFRFFPFSRIGKIK